MMKKLNKIQDNNPFKVPGNYFEEVNKKIISAATGYIPEVKKMTLYNRLRPYLLVAAAVTGFILLSYTALKLYTSGGTGSAGSEVIQADLQEAYVNDIDINTLEEDAASVVLSDRGPGVAKSEIIDYLLLDNVEISDIYEHL